MERERVESVKGFMSLLFCLLFGVVGGGGREEGWEVDSWESGLSGLCMGLRGGDVAVY